MNIGNLFLTIASLGILAVGGLYYAGQIMKTALLPNIALFSCIAAIFVLWIAGGFLSTRAKS